MGAWEHDKILRNIEPWKIPRLIIKASLLKPQFYVLKNKAGRLAKV